MKRLIVIAALVPSLAFAEGFGGFPGSFNGSSFNGPVNVNASTGNNPTGTPVVANGGMGGAGGLGGSAYGGTGIGGSAVGGTASASATGNGSVSVAGDANKAYALGMAGLTSSYNACQGSFSIAFLAATYTVQFCALIQKAQMMSVTGFDKRSVQNVLCLDPEIAQSASECANLKQ
jgi:hypothetical protein